MLIGNAKSKPLPWNLQQVYPICYCQSLPNMQVYPIWVVNDCHNTIKINDRTNQNCRCMKHCRQKLSDKQILGFANLIPMSVHVSTCGIPRTHEDHKLEQFEESMEMAIAEAIKRLFCPNLSSSATNACHNAIKINDRTDHNSANVENS
ncbi:hypothetical protein OIU78_000136 [Salix suchowensis]|nr:hypothetical protein OIU78_000136 [Salix suchowensis]